MIISREITPKVTHWLDKNKILFIKGSRQVGKTTLMKDIQEKLKSTGKHTYYLSVDRELNNPVLSDSRHFLRFLQDQFTNIAATNKLYLFLDEFQYLKDSGIFLKTLFDMAEDTIQIVASGSSSLEITKNSEFLTGRKVEFYLYPLSYSEFCGYKTGLILPDNLALNKFESVREFYEIYKEKLNDPLLEYCSFGGYPEIATTGPVEDKIVILKELVRTYIEKDIIAFLKVENVSAFLNLIKILCDQSGNLVNKSELSNTLKLGSDTLNKYLDILEGTYIVDLIKPYFTNVRKELSKMRKVYLDDFGLRNTILNRSQTQQFLYRFDRENFVYNTLKVKYSKEAVKFYRTISKAEIDFIIDLDGKLIPIEVKSASKIIPVPKIMKTFQNKRKGDQSIIVTDDLLDYKDNNYFIPLTLLPFIGL